MFRELFDMLNKPVVKPSPNQRRPVTEADRLGWYDAGSERAVEDALRPQTVEALRDLIKARNPVRWYTLQKDYKWVQKELIKLGRNPEDARYLL